MARSTIQRHLISGMNIRCISGSVAAGAGVGVLAVGLLAGCAGTRHALALGAIGPAPAITSGEGAEGSLQVFSAFDPTPDLQRTPYRRRHTAYRILAGKDHHLVREVANDNGTSAGGPQRVDLPVGEYTVIARANSYGTVTVPVIIRPRQLTTVHLEGGVWWPKGLAIEDSDPVRLPGGEIAGWRAE